MKFDSQTLAILKNFSSINPSLCFKEGLKLKTISPSKTILAQSNVLSGFAGTFAIYDLNRFLSVLSLFDTPTIVPSATYLKIQDTRQTINYTFADPSVIVTAPDKVPAIQDPEIVFDMQAETLLRTQKAMNVLSLPELSVVGVDGKILVRACDTKNPSSDVFDIEVGETEHTFNMIFKSDNVKLMPANYNVKISSKGIGYFTNEQLEYWVTTEAASTFGGK
jgi:hypothetical protein